MTSPGPQGGAQAGAGGLAGRALALHVRRHDPDRFLFSLFLPAAMREAAWVLIAFNHELARALEGARHRPEGRHDDETGRFAALVRLQWWREVIEGARRRHEVATPLGALIDAGRLDPAGLDAMIAARETELDGPPDIAAWLARLRAGPGTLARMMAAPGDAASPASQALVAAGAAYGAGASLRNRAALLAVGRAPFPADTPDAAALAAAAGARLLAAPRRVAGPALAPALHAVLARRDLGRLRAGREQPGPRGAADRLAVLAAGLRGRA